MAAILLPLLASMIQPVGFLLIKKGTNKPLEAFQAALITIIFFALLFLPFLFFTPKSNWGLPLVAAVLSALGQVLLFLSVINCEVSVITPIMGSIASWLKTASNSMRPCSGSSELRRSSPRQPSPSSPMAWISASFFVPGWAGAKTNSPAESWIVAEQRRSQMPILLEARESFSAGGPGRARCLAAQERWPKGGSPR